MRRDGRFPDSPFLAELARIAAGTPDQADPAWEDLFVNREQLAQEMARRQEARRRRRVGGPLLFAPFGPDGQGG